MPVSINTSVPLYYVVIAGSDKLTVSGFMRWLMKVLGKSYAVGEMHSLMSADSAELWIKDFSSKNKKGIVSYYARRKINVPDPLTVIPEGLKNKADLILWFELYAPVPKILKAPEGNSTGAIFIDEWKKFIKEV